MIYVIALAGIVAFVIGWPSTLFARTLGRRLGHLDSPGSPGHTKLIVRRIPNTGGIAITLAILAPLVIGTAIALSIDPVTIDHYFPGVSIHLAGFRERQPMMFAMIACLAAIHVVGVIDDRRPLGPGLKLAVEFAAAFAMAYFFNARLLTLLDSSPSLASLAPWPSVIVSILWIVVVTNSINMLDNMDGLAAGVSAIASSIFLAAAVLNQQWFIAAMLALLLGALLAFLCFNFPRASIFMGDGGSLPVGFLLALLTVRTTYTDSADPTKGWYGVFMPLIVLAIPLYDLTFVCLLRLRQGRRPWVGDQQHFSHRLVRRGLSSPMAVVVIYGCTLATGLGGIMLAHLQPWQAVLVGIQTLVILAVLAVFELAAPDSGGVVPAEGGNHVDDATSRNPQRPAP